MEDLIKALQIMRKYRNPSFPTHCSHDLLFVNVNPEVVSSSDKEELKTLGFFVSEERGFEDGFCSFKFGSC